MRLPIFCSMCAAEGEAPRDIIGVAIPVPEDGFVEVHCANGHEYVEAFQHLKFELLAESGVQAIADSHYAAGIGAFASSVERLYEFFLKAHWLEKGASLINVKRAWKPISRLSERQIGAFYGAYFAEYQESAPLMPQSETALRNNVTHNGYFPSRAEAIKYAEAARAVSRVVLSKLGEDRYKMAKMELAADQLKPAKQFAERKGLICVFMNSATPISLNFSGVEATIEQLVERAASRNQQGRSAIS